MPSRYRLSDANPIPGSGKDAAHPDIAFWPVRLLWMFSPSALVMTIISAISIMPRLMPCNSSPAPEIWSIMNISTIECTAVSDCPTPTVSMKMTSNPAASHRMIVSRVLRATPPSDPAEGEGRMKTSGLPEMLSMRVLSPRIEPPLRSDEGSMASTASLCRSEVTMLPTASMKVDFPAPGTPVMPMRTDFPACGRHFSMISCAWA